MMLIMKNSDLKTKDVLESLYSNVLTTPCSTIVLSSFYFCNLMIVKRSWILWYAQPCYQD